MLEIDGEFFEDPCQEAKNKKNMAILSLILENAVAIVDLINNNNPFAFYALMHVQTKLFNARMAAIVQSHIFPYIEKGETYIKEYSIGEIEFNITEEEYCPI